MAVYIFIRWIITFFEGGWLVSTCSGHKIDSDWTKAPGSVTVMVIGILINQLEAVILNL